jgi:hypothetical protein
MKEMVKLTGVTLSASRKVMVMPNKRPRKIPIISFTWGQRKEGAVKHAMVYDLYLEEG